MKRTRRLFALLDMEEWALPTSSPSKSRYNYRRCKISVLIRVLGHTDEGYAFHLSNKFHDDER